MAAAVRLSLVFTVACAGLLTAAGAASAPRKAEKHPIAMEAVAFQPADVTVNAGDTIVWTNKDPFPHTVTSKESVFDSKPIAAGGTWTYRAQKKGDYPYVCSLHPTMSGTIHVK